MSINDGLHEQIENKPVDEFEGQEHESIPFCERICCCFKTSSSILEEDISEEESEFDVERELKQPLIDESIASSCRPEDIGKDGFVQINQDFDTTKDTRTDTQTLSSKPKQLSVDSEFVYEYETAINAFTRRADRVAATSNA